MTPLAAAVNYNQTSMFDLLATTELEKDLHKLFYLPENYQGVEIVLDAIEYGSNGTNLIGAKLGLYETDNGIICTTLAHMASINDNEEMLIEILDKAANVTKGSDSFGNYPVHRTANNSKFIARAQ